jgi:preprotein translocase subunit SecF
MRFKYWFFAISLIAIIPGIYSLIRYGLNLSIDFTGGSLIEIKSAQIKNDIDVDKIKSAFKLQKVVVASVQKTGNGGYLFRTQPIETKTKDYALKEAKKTFPNISELRFETVGPVIGAELTTKALEAVLVASLAIVLYIAYAFREIPKPYASWKFGVAAVIALLHDALVVIGAFSLLGHFLQVQVDALFVTAILTVIGFSVHDTIVVFDRVRENLRKTSGKFSFENVVNESILQTLGRSLTTSLTVLFTLLALILFGGESIRWFVVALFIGVFSGTYSSIFNAAPILSLWEESSAKSSKAQ